MGGFLGRWLVTAIAVLAAAHLVSGVSYDSYGALAVAALVLGVCNAVLKPILMFLTLPFLILSLGLFTLVINGLLFWLVGTVVIGFHVAGFWSGLWGALIVSVVSIVLNSMVYSQGRITMGPRYRKGADGRDIIDV